MASSTARKYGCQSDPTYWCTATYAVGRPYAVESSASSAAANRTSTGNDTGSRWRSTSRVTACTASRAAARGSAHSDSVNRTRRSLAKTRWLSSSRVLPLMQRAGQPPQRGLAARHPSAGALQQVEGPVGQQVVGEPGAPAGGGSAGSSVRREVITRARPE